jgi:hypothetical protein
MIRLRRRPGALYRVYDEEEYLAADALTVWEGSPSDEPKRGRRLQRIAGAAALTGAVGTVAGIVGLTGIRAQAVDRREIAQRIGRPVRIAASRGHVSAPAHAARRQIPHPSRSRRVPPHRRTPVQVSRGPGSRAEASARAIAVSASPSTPVHRSDIDEISDRPASAEQVAATEMVSAARETSTIAPDAHPRAQSEFGFER